MEAVFSGGDIVKQLPQEAKRFQNIDKGYMKVSQLSYLILKSCCNSILTVGSRSALFCCLRTGATHTDCEPSNRDPGRGGHMLWQRAAAHSVALSP